MTAPRRDSVVDGGTGDRPGSGAPSPRAAIAVAAGLLLLVLLAFLAWRLIPERDPTSPIVGATMAPVRASAVAETAELTLASTTFSGTPVAVVSAGGALLGGLPTIASAAEATAEVRLASGTVVAGRVQVDALRGVSAVDAPRPGGTAELEIGDLVGVPPGTELILAPGNGMPAVRVKLVGPAMTPIGTAGLLQHVVELSLPAGVSAVEGPVLDAEGRLVGLVVRDRQGGAPLGSVYAVPAEQVRPLLERLPPIGAPPPTQTLEPGRGQGD